MADAMSCEEATDLLALDAVGALEASDRDLVERHVATCATCTQAAAQYADLAVAAPGRARAGSATRLAFAAG